MNYIREINAFRNYLKTNPLEAITQALWYVIADYHNSSNWERWITIDNSRLTAELCISEKTLIKHRNKLIQAGLLEYKSQQRKKGSGKYKLLSFELGEVMNFSIETAVKNTAERKAENETAYQTAVKNTAERKAENETAYQTAVKNTAERKAENETAYQTAVKNTADWKAENETAYQTAVKNTADWKAENKTAYQTAYRSAVKIPDIYKLNKTKLNNNIYIYNNISHQKIEDVKKIFSYWNEKAIIKHKQLSTEIMFVINSALNNYSLDEICRAIDNYAVILNSDKYYWTYRCSLIEFIEKNLDKFMDFDTAAKNYTKNQIQTSGQNTTGLNKTMDFNKYEQHEYTEEQLESLFEPIGEGYF